MPVNTMPATKTASEAKVPSKGPAAATSKYCLRFFGNDSRGVIAPNRPSWAYVNREKQIHKEGRGRGEGGKRVSLFGT